MIPSRAPGLGGGSVEMTFSVGTRDGTVVIVDQADLEWITAYLVLRGYPPVSVEVSNMPLSDLSRPVPES
jgi:hypothetical protein